MKQLQAYEITDRTYAHSAPFLRLAEAAICIVRTKRIALRTLFIVLASLHMTMQPGDVSAEHSSRGFILGM